MGPISKQAQLPGARPALSETATRRLRWRSHRYVGGVVLLAAAYCGAAKAAFSAGVASERARSSRELAEARRRADDRALEDRQRLARDLHDSVSQALFTTMLHARTAQRAFVQEGNHSGRLGRSLGAIADLTRSAQSEMRALIFELHRKPPNGGLVAALARQGARVRTSDGPTVEVRGPASRLALSALAETALFAIGREALANVQRHADATTAHVLVEAGQRQVVVEVRDDGRGFDPAAGRPGHFGLDSMRSRAAEIGGLLEITSAPGSGTLVRVCVPAETDGA
jgi:signal transduction histidine kinase